MLDRIRTVLARFIPTGDITEQTVKSGVWVSGLNVVNRMFQLTMVLIVARLIGPAEFGLMSASTLALGAFTSLSQLGIDTALIQRIESNVDRCLNTAWVLQIARGAIITVLIYATAPFIAEFFNDSEITAVLRLLAFIPLLKGLQNPGILYFQKDLEFHLQFLYSLSSTVVRVFVSIGYALVSPSVWALAVGFVSAILTKLGGSYLLHSYRPRPGFNREIARELLGYGKWIFVSRGLAYLGGQGDDAFVGWYLGTGPLALYRLGFRLSNAPATEVTHTISSVVFPAYSKIQDDVAALRQGYFDTLQLISFISFPMAVGIIVVTPPFVTLVLGSAWVEMIVPMQLLAVYGLFRSVRSAAIPLFRAVGRPNLETRVRAIKLALLAIAIYPATAEYGLIGVAFVVLGQSLVGGVVALGYSIRMVQGTAREVIHLLGYPVLGSLLMGGVVTSLRSQFLLGEPALALLVLIPTGIITYAVVMWTFERYSKYEMATVLATIRDSL